jgi:hypothetical protein
LDAGPAHPSVLPNFAQNSNPPLPVNYHTTMDGFYRNVKQFQSEVDHETKHLDNILKSLQQYYNEVKTKRQLKLDVLAGFCKTSVLQQNFRAFTSPRKSTSMDDLFSFKLSHDEPCFQDLTGDDASAVTQIHSNCSSDSYLNYQIC